jgi:peptidoglycan/xylan/chitin deacetylase (PgdA/CDA1 family)
VGVTVFVRVVKLVISASMAGADWVWGTSRHLLRREIKARCVVLYYHAIRAAETQRFARQLDLLKRLAVPIDLEYKQPLQPGGRYCAVTFDDAFVSVVDNALPELRARGIPCTIFVPTGSIGRHPAWLERSHNDATEKVADAPLLQAIVRQGLVRIGSHSVSHPDFRQLAEAEAREELRRSKAELEEILGREVVSFSFPHGAYTARSMDIARECGYTRVFTIEPARLADPYGEFAIGRVRVQPTDWPIEFRLKVRGAYRWMASASDLKRRLLAVLHGRRAKTAAARQGT